MQAGIRFDDLVKGMYMLIGGRTGRGKSVFIYALIHSLVHFAQDKVKISIYGKAKDFSDFKKHLHRL